jgi:uncharacterized glyoxalase superfamily protein PhnB
MLSLFLACEDPYETADLYVQRLGWRLVFATPPESGDRMALVELGDAQVHLGTAEERFLPARSREHRGAGVTVYIRLPVNEDISAIHTRHAAAGVVTTPLAARPWGEMAFDAVIDGYRFLIGQQPADAV